MFDIELEEFHHTFPTAHNRKRFILFELLQLLLHTDWVKSIGMSPLGRYILSGSADHTIGVFDIQLKEARRKYHDIHAGKLRGDKRWS